MASSSSFLKLAITMNRDLWEGAIVLSIRRVIVAYSQPIRFARLDSGHAQSDEKSVNRGLTVLDLPRVLDSWCWPKGTRPLGTRMVNVLLFCFLCPRISEEKVLFIPIFKRWAVNTPDSFFQSFQRLHFPFQMKALSLAHPFRKMAMQFIMSHISFGKSLSPPSGVGYPGQDKPGALQKVETG